MLILIMVIILTIHVLFLVTSSLYVRVLFLRKHPYNILQLYLLQMNVLKKLLGCEILLLNLALHKVPQLCFLIVRVQSSF